MIDFKDVIAGSAAAVSTSVIELLEQILSDLVAEQLALLILDASDLWILYRLRIEPNGFQGYRCYRCPASQAPCPGENVGDAALQ
jgi:hypothetical protein